VGYIYWFGLTESCIRCHPRVSAGEPDIGSARGAHPPAIGSRTGTYREAAAPPAPAPPPPPPPELKE
jgi:hypothetical protein